ncbi:MAG TPA: hypothetical protein P5218_11090, partial [Planctomycetota bacterium]|nr:hypothetical protein [Planctomycetota bacterium]
PLGELPGGEDSGYALAASYDESIVVGNCSVEIQVDMLGNSWSVEGGFVWTNAAGMQAIAQPAKDFLARGISADGAVIFGSGLGPASGQPSVALRRVSGQPIEELLLPQGTSYCLASNQNGSVILGQAQNSIVWGHSSYTGAFLWRAGQGAVALEDALLAAGVNLPSGFTLTRAITLAPTGDAVLGLGRDAQNVEHAYLAYLVAPALEVGTHGCDPGQANSTGGPATLRALGYGYLSGPGLALSVEGLPPGVTCLLLASRAPGLVPLPGGSEGELCLGGSIGRFGAPQEIQQADSFGQAELSLDFASLPQPTGRVAILAGETWYFQAWYRDSNPTMTSNFSSTTAHLFVP